MKYIFFYIWAVSVLFLPASASAGERATVAVENAPVYSHQRTAPNEVVRSFKRGDTVLIDLVFASAKGEWCKVSEPDKGAYLGYMRCQDLQREPNSHTYVRIPTEAAAEQKTAAPEGSTFFSHDPDLAMPERYMYPLRYWPALFEFTAAQRSSLDELADRMAVTTCRERYEAFDRVRVAFLRHGISVEELGLQTRQFFDKFFGPCMRNMLRLLEQLPGLMTPDQRQAKAELLASFKKQVAAQLKLNHMTARARN